MFSAPWTLIGLFALIGLHLHCPATAVAQGSVPIPIDSLALRDPVAAKAGAGSMLLRRNQQLGVRSKLAGEKAEAASRNNANSMYAASRTTYVVGGAIVGALVTAVAFRVYLENAGSDTIVYPFVLVPIVIGGAAIGALLGLVISG